MASHAPLMSLPHDFPPESEVVIHFGYNSEHKFADELLDDANEGDLLLGRIESFDNSAQPSSKTLEAELHELSHWAAVKLDGESFSALLT